MMKYGIVDEHISKDMSTCTIKCKMEKWPFVQKQNACLQEMYDNSSGLEEYLKCCLPAK